MSTVLHRFLLASASTIGILSAFSLASYGQGLPPTNFGKFVHQPGDNQYEEKAQRERHSPPPMPRVQSVGGGGAAGGGGGGGGGAPARAVWRPTPAPNLPDISIVPIVADEPIKPSGFPPLPDRLDLPVTSSWQTSAAGSGFRPINNSAPSGGGGNDPRRLQGVHEHYYHYQPGACIPQNQQSSGNYQQQGGGAQNNVASAPSGGGGGNSGGGGGGGAPPQRTHSGYRCLPPDRAPAKSDYYSSSTGNGASAAAAPQEREPRLNSRNDVLNQPDAPSPVVVSQSATQDLSVPEDEFSAQNPTTKNNSGKQVARGIQRTAVRTMRRMTNSVMYGGGGMMGGGMMGFH